MKQRLAVAGAISGLGVLVLVTLVIFQFGRHDPSPPSLADSPNPAIPGELLFLDEDECVIRMAASGATREQIYCGTPPGINGIAQVVWVDAKTIGFTAYTSTQQMLISVDIATKQVVGEKPIAIGKDPFLTSLTAPDGTTASSGEGGVIALTKDGQRTEAWDTGTEEWRVQPILWSPDSQWLVVFYSPPRGATGELWLMSRDGKTRGTLATDVMRQMASWRIDGVGITPAIQ